MRVSAAHYCATESDLNEKKQTPGCTRVHTSEYQLRFGPSPLRRQKLIVLKFRWREVVARGGGAWGHQSHGQFCQPAALSAVITRALGARRSPTDQHSLFEKREPKRKCESNALHAYSGVPTKISVAWRWQVASPVHSSIWCFASLTLAGVD